VSRRSPYSAWLTRALHRASTLSRDDWGVLACALGLLLAVSVGLRLVGLRRMIALGDALAAGSRRRGAGDARDVARTAWLVEIAGRCCRPRPTCLAKALVVFALLRRRGLPAELVIGVSKTRAPLEGHAWVELGGAAIAVADPGPASYAVLLRIPAWQPPPATIALRERSL
jgi:transglutaminase superfamily protein